jgi:hypothetical protein
MPGNYDRFTEREEAEQALLLPIEEGEVVGRYVIYFLDENRNEVVLFSTNLYALESAEMRTRNNDFAYYRDKYMSMIFSFRALPYWLSAAFVVFIIIWLVSKRIHSKRNRMYTLRKRY